MDLLVGLSAVFFRGLFEKLFLVGDVEVILFLCTFTPLLGEATSSSIYAGFFTIFRFLISPAPSLNS
jgi:hypothetical protein